MEKYNLKNDIRTFGIEVKTFPEGIGEAFETLANKISEEYDRPYYGISQFTDNGISYKAATEERYEGEAKKYDCKQFIIEKGEYLMVLLRDWRKKTDSIKDIFHEMMQDKNVDHSKPCIEWYKDDDEMICMVQAIKTI